MAQKIFTYCRNSPEIPAIANDREALQRLVKLKAMEYGIDNAANFDECLNNGTINEVMNLIGTR